MKKILLVLAAASLLSGTYAFAANGDLTVNGNAAIGGNTSVGGNVGIGTTTPSQKLDVNGNIIGSGNITANGNIGIGTTAPSQKLELVGGGFKLNSTGGTKPACSAATQGTMWFTQGTLGSGGGNGGTGGTGTPDKLEMCGRNSAGTYSWKTVATW